MPVDEFGAARGVGYINLNRNSFAHAEQRPRDPSVVAGGMDHDARSQFHSNGLNLKAEALGGSGRGEEPRI